MHKEAGMFLRDIQKQCGEDGARWFPNQQLPLVMLTFGLVGETGEFADEIKKVLRGSTTLEDNIKKIRTELTDAFIYLMCLAYELDIDLMLEYNVTRELNELRFTNGDIDEGDDE